ncbi:hypothetical protein AM500_01270 [Bacillus sp. FJAT-18017]|uniref:hypothetical protein n=1 Tax=Bacillus sp. FJAT-18017 TaxID=1705566 RepID=UPI0006ADF8F2|nr:hypothetical protein [Bacillus sp. FJAT-18017]ALC92603.1 hypothetical protein AM500_01270 [Bacillus sp. FJAT-18017]
MNKSNTGEIKRGQTLSFRIPSDTPDHLLKHLQKLKQTERRNFSSKIADFVLDGVGKSSARERETITIPLPHQLSKSQRDWLKHEHSEALLGNIIYQLLTDPVRATALLASMNSKSLDIDEALYLQENSDLFPPRDQTIHQSSLDTHMDEAVASRELDDMDDDLDSFDWESAKLNADQVSEEPEEETEEDLGDLLGDFLAKMNK